MLSNDENDEDDEDDDIFQIWIACEWMRAAKREMVITNAMRAISLYQITIFISMENSFELEIECEKDDKTIRPFFCEQAA